MKETILKIMKNLGKTIDQILKVDPSLEGKLTPIKNKWKKFPSRTMNYWKEFLDYLNSPSLLSHPKRSEMKDIISKQVTRKSPLYSFEDCTPLDKIIGAIPENLADIIRRHDRLSIEIAKLNIEAEITKNADLKAEVARKEALLDINSKKLWFNLRDTFQLWKRPVNFTIKKNNGLLVLVETMPANIPAFIGPGIVKMDETTLRQFLQYLGYNPPSEESNQ